MREQSDLPILTDEETTAPMQRLLELLVITAALASAGGGSVDVALQKKVADEARFLTPAVEDDQAVRGLGETAAMEGLPEPESFSVPDDAGMETYVQIALAKSPGIHRAIRRLQMLGFRVPQVTSLRDPGVHLQPPIGNMAETAVGMVDGGVGISQSIPFPDKLDTRGQIAEQEVRMALDELDEVLIGTVVGVLQAFDRYLDEVSI